MKVCLFFDGKNFYTAMKSWDSNFRVNYNHLVKAIINRINADVVFNGAYYYVGTGPGSNLGSFINHLKLQPGYFVRTRERKHRTRECPHCKAPIEYTEEKEVDTLMVSEMIQLAAQDAFDIAVLFSGDSDLVPAAESLRSLGKKVILATWGNRGLAKRLREYAFDQINLVDIKEDIK